MVGQRSSSRLRKLTRRMTNTIESSVLLDEGDNFVNPGMITMSICCLIQLRMVELCESFPLKFSPSGLGFIAFIDDGAWKRFHELLDHFPMPIERIVAGKLLALHKRVDQLCARAIRWAKLRRKLKIVASEDIHSKEEVEKGYIEFAEKAYRLDLRIICN
ncbi:hypothetical protein LXL04_035535 [Taraxacum kok-saghyz]